MVKKRKEKVKRVIERHGDMELVEYHQADNPVNAILGSKVRWRKTR